MQHLLTASVSLWFASVPLKILTLHIGVFSVKLHIGALVDASMLQGTQRSLVSNKVRHEAYVALYTLKPTEGQMHGSKRLFLA